MQAFNGKVNGAKIRMSKQQTEFIKTHLTKPIALIGMMGAGKSHTGAELARTLGLGFVDSDKMIEEKAGRPIADIFEEFGEEKFRESEHKTILELLQEAPKLIATGGGAVTNPVTLEALKAQSLMVWLNADVETLWQRVQKSQNRPLLKTENPREKLESLLEQRKPLYAQAHVMIEIQTANQNDDVEGLIKILYAYLNTDTV